jgi:hypothetical protein
MTTTGDDPQAPPPVKYGTFHNRMIASTLDICLLFVVALPAVDYMMSQLFPPIDMDRIAAVMQSPEFKTNAQRFAAALWKAMEEQHVVERMIVENLLQVAFISLYILPCWFRYSSTPGKMLFRLQIVDAKTGERMSDRQAVIRFLAYFFSILPLTLGLVWIMFDKKRRGIHDLIAGTVVVVKPKKPKASALSVNDVKNQEISDEILARDRLEQQQKKEQQQGQQQEKEQQQRD